MPRITVKSLQAEVAELREWHVASLQTIAELKAQLEATSTDRRAADKGHVFRNKQVRPLTGAVMKAHSDYVAALAAARDLAMRSGRSVRVG